MTLDELIAKLQKLSKIDGHGNVDVLCIGEEGDVSVVDGVEFNHDDGPAILLTVGPWS